MKPGVSEQQAQTELTALIRNWGEHVGVKQHVFSPPPAPGAANAAGAGAGHVLQMKPVQEEIIGGASRMIWVLQAAVGLVLLIACANLANLLLARAKTRHREFAVRAALGAGRLRILRQFLAEGVLLSLAGGALGLVLARAGLQALIRWYPDSLPRTSELTVDAPVLLFTLGVSLATALVFGLAPLTHTHMAGLATALKEGTRGASGAARHHLRRALVMAEVAMAVMLVIGAGLLLRTVYNLAVVDAGFDRSRLVTFSMSLPAANYPQPPARAQLYQRLLDTLRRVPGVQAASAMTGLPPNRPVNANDTEIDNYTAPPEGPFENVIPWFTVVGVAKDVKQGGVDQKTGTEFYFLVDQTANIPGGMATAPATMNIVLRTTLPSAALATTIESAVRDADASVPVVRLRAMDDVFAESVRRPRLLAQLLGAFAGLALLLAAIGTYGVLSYMVTQRRCEIGIRMALGADQRSVVGLVMRQGLIVTAAGLVAGLAGAMALSQLIASLLFGVQPSDPATFMAVAATIGLVAAAACGLPAWRASRVDPTVVLRDE